ncbi:MAG: ExbD/TolR family protein [Xanthomonadaceae bacterium]|nr:ExbD/TolR family protein [Xanthomonadaceae bacterium]
MKMQSTQTALSEINVTPLVDVMLVLLIVFMISAPMMQQGVQVELPKANAGSLNESPEPLVLVVNADRSIAINGHKIPLANLRTKLTAIAAAKPNIDVLVQADQSVPYGIIAKIIAEVKQSKITRVGLVTEPDGTK